MACGPRYTRLRALNPNPTRLGEPASGAVWPRQHVGQAAEPGSAPRPAWCLLSRARRMGRAFCSRCWITTRWGLMTLKGRPSCRCARCRA